MRARKEQQEKEEKDIEDTQAQAQGSSPQDIPSVPKVSSHASAAVVLSLGVLMPRVRAFLCVFGCCFMFCFLRLASIMGAEREEDRFLRGESVGLPLSVSVSLYGSFMAAALTRVVGLDCVVLLDWMG